jgi:hypothetical protein
MARRKFTTRGSFQTRGRQAAFFGTKTHARYAGGGFTVEYEKRASNVFVTVTMEGHAPIRWQCMGVIPTPEVAKIHAASAFRTHFKIHTGDPSDFEAKALTCRCH